MNRQLYAARGAPVLPGLSRMLRTAQHCIAAVRCGSAVPHQVVAVRSLRWIANDSQSDARQAAADLYERSHRGSEPAQTKPSDGGNAVAINRSGLWSNPPHGALASKQPHTPLSRDIYNYIKARPVFQPAGQ